MKYFFSLVLPLTFILSGCFTPPGQSPFFPAVVAPEHIRLKATILSIDSTLLKDDADINDPCSLSPCMAEVRIDSLEGFGMGAKPVLSGDKIKVKFALTMNAVIDNADTLQSLPGLKIDDTFRAEVQAKKDEKILIVHKYLKQKKQ